MDLGGEDVISPSLTPLVPKDPSKFGIVAPFEIRSSEVCVQLSDVC